MNNDIGLLLLFLYSIPCEFVVSLAPHEPAILYFAGDHLPIVIAIVAGAGTLVAEIINYELLRRLSRSRLMPAASHPESGQDWGKITRR
ncbi:MAG: hypothetical protein ABIW94_10220 [Gemmatimonadaceae bacterium]